MEKKTYGVPDITTHQRLVFETSPSGSYGGCGSSDSSDSSDSSNSSGN